MRIATLSVALAVVAAVPAGADELKFAHFVPPQHTITAAVMDPLTRGLAEATGGALTVHTYPGGELGAGPAEQYVRALQGVADITFGLQGYTSSVPEGDDGRTARRGARRHDRLRHALERL